MYVAGHTHFSFAIWNINVIQKVRESILNWRKAFPRKKICQSESNQNNKIITCKRKWHPTQKEENLCMQEGTAGWSSQESKQISSGKGSNCALILENKELPGGKTSFSKHCPIVNANLLFQRGLEGKKVHTRKEEVFEPSKHWFYGVDATIDHHFVFVFASCIQVRLPGLALPDSHLDPVWTSCPESNTTLQAMWNINCANKVIKSESSN